MPEYEIDLSVIGKKTKETVFEYDWKDVVLYALSIGATPEELPFVYERAKGGLKVYPSYTTLIAFSSLPNPGSIEIARYLHSEQLIRMHRPLKKKDKITRVGVITNMYDKGKGAVIHSLIMGHDKKGNHIFDTEWTHFYLGGGGFGGERGPKVPGLSPPVGVDPDFRMKYNIQESQAALYRLNGDFNPIHIDKKYARIAGQDKPFIHGLCTYGFATRAIIEGACKGDVNRFKEFKARFSEVVFPGEILTIEGWKVEEKKYVIQAKTERATVLTHAYAIID